MVEGRKTFSKLLTRIRSGQNSETRAVASNLRGGQGKSFGHVMILRADATCLPAHQLFEQHSRVEPTLVSVWIALSEPLHVQITLEEGLVRRPGKANNQFQIR
jgi:hypothetical protein